MATKSKTAGENVNATVEGIEATVKNGTEAFKTGFEKAVKNYDMVLGYGKQTMEAYTTAASAAGKGAETIHSEMYAYSKQSIEDSIAAAKAVFAAKSVQEAFELHSDFARTAFDSYVGQVNKMGEIFAATTKKTIEPLQNRYQAWVEVVQNARVG